MLSGHVDIESGHLFTDADAVAGCPAAGACRGISGVLAGAVVCDAARDRGDLRAGVLRDAAAGVRFLYAGAGAGDEFADEHVAEGGRDVLPELSIHGEWAGIRRFDSQVPYALYERFQTPPAVVAAPAPTPAPEISGRLGEHVAVLNGESVEGWTWVTQRRAAGT